MERFFMEKKGNTTLPADSQQMITNAAQAAGVGAMAGISLAQMFGAPAKTSAMVGAGLGCLFGALMMMEKDD